MEKSNTIHLSQIDSAKFRVKWFIKEYHSFYDDAHCHNSIWYQLEEGSKQEEYKDQITPEDVLKAKADFEKAHKDLKTFMCSENAEQFIKDVEALTSLSWAMLARK